MFEIHENVHGLTAKWSDDTKFGGIINNVPQKKGELLNGYYLSVYHGEGDGSQVNQQNHCHVLKCIQIAMEEVLSVSLHKGS